MVLMILGGAGQAVAGQLTLTWEYEVTEDIGFSVERSTGPAGEFAELATTVSGVAAYTDFSIPDESTYCYRVRAFNAEASSRYSDVACGTTAPVFGLAVVMKADDGSGTVTSEPSGIDCGSECLASYPEGTAVTLTASPATDSVFMGWTGDSCTGTDPCTVTLTEMATVTVTADFALSYSALLVSVAGSGRGGVTSEPAGIQCGRVCSATYVTGTTLTLTAIPAGPGSTFTGWSGGSCAATNPCTLTLTESVSVTATFAKGTGLARSPEPRSASSSGSGTGSLQ
jgi:hypothetical protein